MRKTFDAELQELNYEMIDMAAAAEDAIDVVTESLASGDDAAAKSAVEMTRSMDQMERDIENRCLRLLLQQQPVARDLRTISAAMKMVTDLQRIGDQCANIAEISLLLKEQKQTRTLADIRTMSQKAGVMVKRSIFAYVNRDTEAAQAVIALDDEVDALFRTIKEELVELMDELDGDARLFGAVNTVCIRDGRAYGYNTDGAGFLRALNDEGIDPAGKRVLVLGAGGAAKAVCLKLAQAGAEVVVCNRTADKAAALCAHEPARLRPAGFDPDTLRRSAGCWSTAPPWVWRGRQGSLRSAPSWTPCPPGRRWWISSTPRRRLSCSAGPGRGGTRPPTVSDCWSTRRCSPWSTSPARPSTPRR